MTVNECEELFRFHQARVNHPRANKYTFGLMRNVRTRRVRGRCNLVKKVIQIAPSHISDSSVEEITDTILHELAHAIIGRRKAGKRYHYKGWREVARALGCTDVDRYDPFIIKKTV